MRFVPGGEFDMGSNRFYPEEAPVRRVRVDSFLMDEVPVTNAEFARFVAATGYVTLAEVAPTIRDYPGLLPEMAVAGSTVFDPDQPAVTLRNPASWWAYRPGANWRRPLGPDSGIEDLDDHPVVHVAYPDARAYADWAGKSLPTEAEWEYAARGGLAGADYAWGNELAPGGVMMANYWQGEFPRSNTLEDGWERTSPVRAFPANGYGLFDTIGNVWEWTQDWWSRHPGVQTSSDCCGLPMNPRGGTEHESHDVTLPDGMPRKVIKGGSHLCALNYCRRFRPAARHPQPIDSPTSHIGFRCVVHLEPGG
ncbi:MAG: formylglycine-generating enzyme family protein [Rhodoferax sp.]|nr:formylglycine-generating enzyme family protein [Rhodoferax sp.]